MLGLVVALTIGQAGIAQPDRLRTILPNEAVVFVEPVRTAPTISLQLWASSRDVPETSETHGLRHLLEHLMLKSDQRDMDYRLEKAGAFMKAHTFRDAMQIELTLPPDRFQLGLEILRELLRPVEFTQEGIDKEIEIIRQEFALNEATSTTSSVAWSLAYGETGLDPNGNLEVMAKATPETLSDLQQKHFAPHNLLVSVVGPVNMQTATDQVAAILEKQTIRAHEDETTVRRTVKQSFEVGFAPAAARAVPVKSYSDPQTAWSLAAALAIASELDGAFVTYTPSANAGLILVGQNVTVPHLGMIDELDADEIERLYPRATVLAKGWIDSYLSSSSGIGYLRGLLMVQGPGFKPEDLLKNIEYMTLEEFERGLNAFKGDRAVSIERWVR